MTAALTDPLPIGSVRAPSRVMFGPHETNLGDGRAIGARHVAYYARRAAGGAGIIVTETASVTPGDWPYERAPAAGTAGPGWQAVGRACAPHRSVVLAGIGHAGGQGSSAYSQEVMWAPSRVADVVTREPPAELEEGDISHLVSNFAAATATAMEAGLAGVELDAGPWSLLRQFHSGLTNLRSDRYGSDRLLFTREVIAAVRAAAGPAGVVALRLSCDELAPWAGVTPEQAAAMVAELAPLVDLLTVVRGGPYSTTAYRPDAHTAVGFNRELCRQMRDAAGGAIPVVLQGSVVDPAMAGAALSEGICDAVEMTRALIADAALVAKVRAGDSQRVRPCIRCNQACRARDNRNPIVSCVLDPASGHETEEPFETQPFETQPFDPHAPAASPASDRTPVLVVGAGPAGLECARVLAAAGRPVTVAERRPEVGGALARAAHGPGRESLRAATDWLHAEARRQGADIRTGRTVDAEEVRRVLSEGGRVVLATGSRPVTDRFPEAGVPVVDALEALESLAGAAGGPSAAARLPGGVGPVVVLDPVGDAVGVNLAEWLAQSERTVTLVAPDPVAGTQLARTGDLADANGRLQRAGVERQLRRVVRGIGDSIVSVEDAWTGEVADLPAAVVVDCGHRLPEEELYLELGDPTVPRIGDCVAPRSLLEAVLEGRRAALGLLSAPAGHVPGPAPQPSGAHR